MRDRYLVAAEATIGKTFGECHFPGDRLDRAERRAAGLDLSKRQYKKRFRLTVRMERKRANLVRSADRPSRIEAADAADGGRNVVRGRHRA